MLNSENSQTYLFMDKVSYRWNDLVFGQYYKHHPECFELCSRNRAKFLDQITQSNPIIYYFLRKPHKQHLCAYMHISSCDHETTTHTVNIFLQQWEKIVTIFDWHKFSWLRKFSQTFDIVTKMMDYFFTN